VPSVTHRSVAGSSECMGRSRGGWLTPLGAFVRGGVVQERGPEHVDGSGVDLSAHARDIVTRTMPVALTRRDNIPTRPGGVDHWIRATVRRRAEGLDSALGPAHAPTRQRHVVAAAYACSQGHLLRRRRRGVVDDGDRAPSDGSPHHLPGPGLAAPLAAYRQ
jgi:hypothetical protein